MGLSTREKGFVDKKKNFFLTVWCVSHGEKGLVITFVSAARSGSEFMQAIKVSAGD